MLDINLTQVTALTFVAIFASGVVTSLTPCVYPILPVVVGYLGGRRGSSLQRFLASLSYALGLSVVYTVLGMIAALTGSMFGTLTSNPYVYLGFGVVMLALGGNMMDWYYIPMPGFAGAKGGDSGNDSSLVGPFLVGLSSGLVASPCTAPVLASLLLFVATTKAVVKGGLLMFTFSMGMSALLIAVGFFASLSSRLPKSGMWMMTIKKVLALLLIGAGIYFIFKAGTLA